MYPEANTLPKQHTPSLQGGVVDKFSFFMSPKIMEDGSIFDFGLGYAYTGAWSGSVTLRRTGISKNEELAGVKDSLNAVNETIYEVFLLPARCGFLENFSLGAGLYYEYDNLREKGFFNMPELEKLNPPRERVNSYRNDFSMHVFGPLVDAGADYSSEWFTVNLSAGIVPVFFLAGEQKTSIVPLLDPHRAAHSQSAFGSPHFYINLDGVILKYINLALLYDFTRLDYKTIDFDEDLAWKTSGNTLITQSIKIEAALSIPMGGGVSFRAGYGFALDSTQRGSKSAVWDDGHYLILSARKM